MQADSYEAILFSSFMELDPKRRKEELPNLIAKSKFRWMRREVDITLGIIIKQLLLGKKMNYDPKEEENIKADLAKGYRFW